MSPVNLSSWNIKTTELRPAAFLRFSDFPKQCSIANARAAVQAVLQQRNALRNLCSKLYSRPQDPPQILPFKPRNRQRVEHKSLIPIPPRRLKSPQPPRHTTLRYTTLFYTLLHSSLSYSTLLNSTLLYPTQTLPHASPPYSTLPYSTLLKLYPTLLYPTQLYPTLLYFALLCCTLLYHTILHNVVLCHIQFQFIVDSACPYFCYAKPLKPPNHSKGSHATLA